MKTLSIIATVVACTLSIFSSADDYSTKKVPVADFNSVECNIPCDVEYTSGEASFEITSTNEVVAHIDAKVKDHKLTISLDKKKFYKFGDTKVRISSMYLDELILNGSVEFEAKEGIIARNFSASFNGATEVGIKGLFAGKAQITSSGAADLEIDGVDCDELKVTVNGAGGCELGGHASKADLVVNGVGSIDARDLKSEAMNSAVNGIGSIKRN